MPSPELGRSVSPRQERDGNDLPKTESLINEASPVEEGELDPNLLTEVKPLSQIGQERRAKASSWFKSIGDKISGAVTSVKESIKGAGRAIGSGADTALTYAFTADEAVKRGATATGEAVARGATATGEAVVAGAQATKEAAVKGGKAVAEAGVAVGRGVAKGAEVAAGVTVGAAVLGYEAGKAGAVWTAEKTKNAAVATADTAVLAVAIAAEAGTQAYEATAQWTDAKLTAAGEKARAAYETCNTKIDAATAWASEQKMSLLKKYENAKKGVAEWKLALEYKLANWVSERANERLARIQSLRETYDQRYGIDLNQA